MDFYSLFKSFFGIPNSVPPPDLRYDNALHFDTGDNDEVPIRQPKQPTSFDDTLWSAFMSDPKDFQNFVEDQMHQIMSSFGFASTGTQFGEPFIPETGSPAMSLRDQYLKPGYDHPAVAANKTDTDLDGTVNLDELDSMLKPAPPMPEPPKSVQPTFKTHVFGQSMSTRTIVKPDGSVETTRTVFDNNGNRETTVTRQERDTQYTVTTRINADGVETKEEELLNLPEGMHTPMMRRQPLPSWFEFFKH